MFESEPLDCLTSELHTWISVNTNFNHERNKHHFEDIKVKLSYKTKTLPSDTREK